MSDCKPVVLRREEVDALFETHTHQAELIIALHELVYGKEKWDKIETLTDFCKSSEECSKYIMEKFITFDKQHHSGVMAGGLWMNNGFSSLDTSIQDPEGFFIIVPAPVIYAEAA